MRKQCLSAPFALLAVLMIVACSGTSTGPGTPTKGRGLFGGGGGTTTADGGIVPSSCAQSTADDSCTACLKQSCCTQTLGCGNDPECIAIFNCAGECADDACIKTCLDSHPKGQASVQTVINCEQQSCVAACEGDGSGTTPGPAADSCLPNTPQDPSYCPNLPNKQVVKDCPNGSPSAACVLSPTGASNVYCCPI